MNNSNSGTSSSSTFDNNVEQALLASKVNFDREYGDGGVVISGVVAIGHDGQALGQIALIPGGGETVLPDSIYADAVEEALARDWVLKEIGAYSGVRIERGWPRVVAWNPERSIVWESKPQFSGEKLIGWEDSHKKELSTEPPTGSTSGLLEIEGRNGAVVLVVSERLKGLTASP